MTEEEEALFGVFCPFIVSRFEEARRGKKDLAHYTSASNACRIIDTKRVTLRNAALMNDFSEIDYGEKCLQTAWSSQIGAGSAENPGRLRVLCDSISPSILPAILDGYLSKLDKRRKDTFILSLCEHDSIKDAHIGKLSMWRAYGGKTNVALVIDSEKIGPEGNGAAMTVPVNYALFAEFPTKIFEPLVRSLENNADLIRSLNQDVIVRWLLHAFNILAMSTKHPGFEEEQEWRVIHAPWLNLLGNEEEVILEINGVPQRAFQISLDQPQGTPGEWMNIPELLKSVLIGPTNFPLVIAEAIEQKLDKAGVPAPRSRIQVSHIPIRRD